MSTATELLRRALDAWDDEFQNIDNASIFSEIRTYLSNPSDDAEEPVAIIEEADYGCWGQILPDKSVRLGQFLYLHPPKPAEPEADPVAWISTNKVNGAKWLEYHKVDSTHSAGLYLHEPLYLHPPRPEPARKPMTEEEINRELPFECSGIYFDGFRAGVRFAEKHHGILEKHCG